MDCLLYDLVSGIIIVKELNTNEESSINSVNVKSNVVNQKVGKKKNLSFRCNIFSHRITRRHHSARLLTPNGSPQFLNFLFSFHTHE